MRRLLTAGLLVLAAAGAACGSDDPPQRPVSGNALANGGFESGADPWTSLDTEGWGKPFSVSDRQAHSGASSALLELRSVDEEGPTRVYGVVQDVTPEAFPEMLSGSYYIDRWEPGTPFQYLQAVVIVEGAANAPPGAQAPNHQLRYLLAGVDQAPLGLVNARYVVAGRAEPELGAWVDFEFDLHEDFERLWGAVPQGFTSMRVLFEVRWDGRVATDPPSAADVYYDDLFLGWR